MSYLDSTGKPIAEGDQVRHRGREYTIKAFRPGEGRSGIAAIDFTEEPHVPGADEWSVDRLDKPRLDL